MHLYSSKNEAIDQAITPALDTPAGYDLDAIFDATFSYDKSKRGFVKTATVEEFWAAVAKHDKGSK